MRYWDASAVVPLCVEEAATEFVQGLLEVDRSMVVWWGTPVECASALARLRRMGILADAGEEAARELLSVYRRGWTEIQPVSALRERALRLLSVHELRAADSVQLAAAVSWAGEVRDGAELVCLDERLSEAARREGFRVLG